MKWPMPSSLGPEMKVQQPGAEECMIREIVPVLPDLGTLPTASQKNIALRDLCKNEQNLLKGLKSWALIPKFCRTFGVLCEGSPAGFLVRKPFRRTHCRTPKVPQNSGAQGGARTHLLRTGLFSSHSCGTQHEKALQDAMGGWKKEGGGETSRMTPLPKKGFWTPPPLYGTFSTPLSCSVFSVQKSTTELTRSSFGGVKEFPGERVLWHVFLPPYVLHPPPHSTGQKKKPSKRSPLEL